MSRSRPGGIANGALRALKGLGSTMPQSTPGNRKGVSPTESVEEFKVSIAGSINNAKIRNPIPIERLPIPRN